MACHKPLATLRRAISLHQGQKDTVGRTKSHFLSTLQHAFYIFCGLSSIISHNFLAPVFEGSEVCGLHFYQSLENTWVSHVKYQLGHSVHFTSFFLSMPMHVKEPTKYYYFFLYNFQQFFNGLYNIIFFFLTQSIPFSR